MIFEVLDHFPGATKRTRAAESIFAIRFERKLLFLGQILIQSIDLCAFRPENLKKYIKKKLKKGFKKAQKAIYLKRKQTPREPVN